MRAKFTDANFPRSEDGRVYHLGLRLGELANRIVTVGDPHRALKLAEKFDHNDGGIIKVESDRGFLTMTGTYKGVPLSVVAIGMGFANMDFFVRECRECVDGDMYIIRFGSCGGLANVPAGSVAVPEASVAITRNYDYDFTSSRTGDGFAKDAYRISKPVPADPYLRKKLVESLKQLAPPGSNILDTCVNASADSFYSSQGRQTAFLDHNENLIEYALSVVPKLRSLEMETFHLLHLAHVFQPSNTASDEIPLSKLSESSAVPPISLPASHTTTPSGAGSHNITPLKEKLHVATEGRRWQGRICACSAQMVFASRTTNDIITPELVGSLQDWAGRACMEALISA
ncbi:purine and uridine phosphorylase [Cantharellus anzutake]|uniref:purine and uridine phosphorylase n=1 Tax=Cantharellus anzutake TaxID=1750568 RepID=UPI001908CB46|nr:purine and uridine phosphorylase [Cantharellus anzutake]KAF8333149.1 purine and uridine phosphorylase [Cantharellus anzutake]